MSAWWLVVSCFGLWEFALLIDDSQETEAGDAE